MRGALLSSFLAVIGLTIFSPYPLPGQHTETISITGLVRSDTYAPLPYANVLVSETSIGTVTDLNGLFRLQLRQVAGRFDVGVLFISRDNPRSLRAHTRHLGMRKLAGFTFDSKKFDLLVFDVYQGKGVPDGKKSLAIRARYRALDRTLTDELIQNLHGQLIKALKKELGV